MRRLVWSAALAAVACAPAPSRTFVVGVLEPVSARVSAEARRLGLAVATAPPEGVAVEDAAVVLPSGGERMADHARLRYLALRAAARGAPGVFWRLPAAPLGADLLDVPEEWQAVARVARELSLMRPVLEAGAPTPSPLAAPRDVIARAWAYQGRRYVLLVNDGPAPAPFETAALAGWRALFEPRASAQEVLEGCDGRLCLPPRGALWLESRVSAEAAR